MEFSITPATRAGLIPLIGFYGKSGSGKTMSALLTARGLAGPTGKIVLVDSENKRGSIFADIIPGSYDVINLDAPFSPERYQKAIATAEEKAAVIVVDSMSHEWSGEGGVLDMAEAELERMGGGDNNKMRSWIKPKFQHKIMVSALLRCRVPLICCLRGEEKTHVTKPENGQKGKVITDDFSSPLFDPRFIFEMLINFETIGIDGVGGYTIPRKITHPAIGELLPRKGEQIGIKHGEAIAKWCKNPGPAKGTPATATETHRNRMIEVLEESNLGEKAFAYAIDKAIILPTAGLDTWPLDKVPTTKAAMDELKKAISEHQ